MGYKLLFFKRAWQQHLGIAKKMFVSLRKNLQSVQEGITAGLQRLSLVEKADSSCEGTESRVNLGAGAELLQMYQTQWQTMHHIAEQNANLAEDIDKAVTSVRDACELQYSQMAEIHSLLAHLPNIMSQLHSMLATIGSMRGLYEEVESGLLCLEDMQNELEVQEKILDMKLELAIEREKYFHRVKELENDSKLADLQKFAADEKKREEREKVFSEKFSEELEEYKKHKTLSERIIPLPEGDVSLEDVCLNDDKSSLDEFLQEPS